MGLKLKKICVYIYTFYCDFFFWKTAPKILENIFISEKVLIPNLSNNFNKKHKYFELKIQQSVVVTKDFF